jgi:hypothetical protein
VVGEWSSVSFSPGHLASNPLPSGIVGALGLGGYQLLVDVAGVGAGRLGSHGFLLVAAEPDPSQPDAGTQISLHQPRLKDEAEASAFAQLAAQLGYLRLSGYRLALERTGLRSKISVVNPATGAIVAVIPDKAAGRLFGGGASAPRLLASVRALPPAGPPPDTQSPELLRQVLLALALRDESVSGAEAAELADRALDLVLQGGSMDPPAALEAAKQDRG